MPNYDVRRTNEILDQVSKDLKKLEDEMKPKKKFAFSRDKNKSVSNNSSDNSSSNTNSTSSNSGGGDGGGNSNSNSGSNLTNSDSNPKPQNNFSIPGSYAIKNEKGKTIVLTASDFDSIIPENSDLRVQILIRDCESCFISM